VKPLYAGLIALGIAFMLWAVYSHLQYFGNMSFLGGILLLEAVTIALWKYQQRFFLFLMVAFLWGGMHLPLQDAWTGGRWVVLAAGAIVGYIVWMKTPRSHFRLIHLFAFFCVFAAFVSATVSPFVQMASFKALSLLLLFLYCGSGARAAVLGREEKFFQGLILASEFLVCATAIAYFVLGQSIWGNPNSMGAAMSIGAFPVLLWGWLVTEPSTLKFRRMIALLLCAFLIVFSMARAGMASLAMVTIVFCFGLHQYKLLAKVTGAILAMTALVGMLAPATLDQSFGDLKDAVLYKGHKDEGVLGSRRKPWEDSINSIQQHPWFGTGYGTAPTGEDPGLLYGRFASSAETAREHGSSYITITEWVGLLGVLPFAAMLVLTVTNLVRVCAWMNRTSNPRHYSIPIAMIVLAGLVHASFEDWLFAVGYYLCVYFWVFAFVLADFVPASNAMDQSPAFARIPARPSAFPGVVPNP
jgi:O-antigen ligase